MTKILCFNANEERIPFITEWSEKHNIQVDYVSEFLTLENVDMVKDYDGITVAQVGEFDFFAHLDRDTYRQFTIIFTLR